MARRSRFLVVGLVAALLLSAVPQGFWGGGAQAAGNPFAGIKWVANAPPEVQQQPGLEIFAPQQTRQEIQTVDWIGGWFPIDTMKFYVDVRIKEVAQAGGIPIFAVYNMVNRDCGGESSGGAKTAADYRAWIDHFAQAINGRKVILILEPDSLTAIYCLDPAQMRERHALIGGAVTRFKQGNPNAAVYIDGVNHGIRTVGEIVPDLQASNIAEADGFFLNSTLYHYTSTEVAYGRAVSAALGGKHFIVDTSRSGLGDWITTEDSSWCNAPGRALGTLPTTNTGDPLVDAFVWIKRVWESDGDCGRGGPPPGQLFPGNTYLLGLVQRSLQPFSDMPTDSEALVAVRELTARGIIRGNGDGTFGTNSPTLRAQMAALIARPLYWEREDWDDASFPDQCDPPGPYRANLNCIDPELWRNVETLAHREVAQGFGDGTYGPREAVLYEQVILFISRAMVGAGFWQQQPDNTTYFPNLPSTTEREKADRRDIATYVFYTQRLGGVPDRPATGPFTAYDQPAPRVWFAVALYRALQSAYLE